MKMFNTDQPVTDVVEIKSTNPISTCLVEVEEVELSKPRVIRGDLGFPFVIHLPRTFFEELTPLVRSNIRKAGVKIESRAPLFMRTDIAYVRLGFVYGDSVSATGLMRILEEKYNALLCYKNWL